MEAARPRVEPLEGGRTVPAQSSQAWQSKLDEQFVTWSRALWGHAPWLDAFAAVVAKWTPIVMLLVITMAVAGVGLTPAEHRTAGAGGICSVVAAMLARVVNEPISRWVDRERPFERDVFPALVWHEPGKAFPSNHATGAFALAVGMGLVPGYRDILYVLAILLCLSRIYGGLHYLTDIIGGVLHGTLVAMVIRLVIGGAA